MIVQNVNVDTFTVTMTIGFLDLIFIKNINRVGEDDNE